MSRSIDEALAEVEREAHVRIRCFDRWVEQGKLSWADAYDRMERLISAVKHLRDIQTANKIESIRQEQLNQPSGNQQVEAWAAQAHEEIDNTTPANLLPLTQPESAAAPELQRKFSA